MEMKEEEDKNEMKTGKKKNINIITDSENIEKPSKKIKEESSKEIKEELSKEIKEKSSKEIKEELPNKLKKNYLKKLKKNQVKKLKKNYLKKLYLILKNLLFQYKCLFLSMKL